MASEVNPRIWIAAKFVEKKVMQEIRTEIIIDAPKEIVWDILNDFKNYSSWNPFITSIEENGPNKLKVNIKPNNGKAMLFKPLILNKEANTELRWLGHLFIPGLFDGEHYFHLEELEKDRTRFVHGEKFSGILSGILLKKIGEDTEASFHTMNHAIKNRSEKEMS